jgi:hypothetical protein
MKMVPIFLVLVASVFFVSCADPNSAQRQLLISELKEVDSNRALLSQAVSSRKSRVASLDQRLIKQRSNLIDYQERVKAYMMNHKMAIAAIGAGAGGTGVAIDPNNEFSDDAKVMGGVVAFIALAYALENMQEIAEVADQLTQADSHVKSLERQISNTMNSLRTEKSQLGQEAKELLVANSRLSEVRFELGALR